MHWIDEHRRIIGLVLVVGGVVLLGLKAWQATATMRSLQSRMAQAQAMARGGATHIDPAAVGALVMGARADVRSLRADLGPLVWLAPRLAWLPGVGGDAQAVPALLDMADGLTEAGVELWQGFAPLLDKPGQASDAPMTQKALAQLVAARPQIERARAALERAAVARASIQTERLSGRLAGQMQKLDALLPLAQVGVGVALAAPEALGQNGPRTYLILAQNEDELRPTGGFITGVGEVQLEAGRLVSMAFRDSYAVDDFSQPYPDPPEPLRRYMGIDLWVFRDSNWSPDFPTAARQAISLYRPGHPVSVDGAIALDQQALQELVDALGPLTVEGAGESVTGKTVIAYIRRAWAPEKGNMTGEWWGQRKSFMGPLAEAAWKQVEAGQVNWIALARALVRLLDEKHLLVYLQQPETEALLSEPGWDGALQPSSGDFLMVVDANVGYNKANARVQQAITYEADLRRSPPQATLTLIYTHTSTANYPCRPEVRYDPVYEQMMDRCYWDYLRVYTPQGSQLLDASRQSIPASYFMSQQAVDNQAQVLEPEVGKSVFASFLVVEPGKNWQTYFKYGLPAGVVRRVGGDWQYSLWLQKQSGKLAIPTVVTVNLPPGAKVISSSQRPTSTQAGRLQFEFLMAQDTYIEVRFRD